LLGILAVVGLVVDGGVLLALHLDLSMLADGAAQAGAGAVDAHLLRGAGELALDAAAARSAALEYLSAAGFRGEVLAAEARGSQIRVRLRDDRPTVLMGLVGIQAVSTEAEGTASARGRLGSFP
ncbi:MAG: hypothetical protein ACRD0D_11280, partial [Acidimicrobiales bacterium]